MIEPHEPPTGDAGLVGLQAEIRKTPTRDLAEQATRLIEAGPAMISLGMPRLRFVLWELQRRINEAEIAA